MRCSSFIHICFVAALVSQVQGQTETTALWLFDEPVGCYPSTTLTDNGPQDITVVLGRGAVMAPGRFGNALAVRRECFCSLISDATHETHSSTSERRLWEGETPLLPVSSLYFSPKDDGAIASGPSGIATLHVRNPHPEVSWKALFGKVWYEGYEAPDYVWNGYKNGNVRFFAMPDDKASTIRLLLIGKGKSLKNVADAVNATTTVKSGWFKADVFKVTVLEGILP